MLSEERVREADSFAVEASLPAFQVRVCNRHHVWERVECV